MLILGELDKNKVVSTALARAVAETIRTCLSEPYRLSITQKNTTIFIEHRCSASIGAVVFVNNDVSQVDILRWVDAAMYQAKENRRNLVRFYEPPDCEMG